MTSVPEIVFDCLECDTVFSLQLATLDVSDQDIKCPVCGSNKFMATTTGFEINNE